MKTLILMRHGKSDWNTPAGDFHRPLLDRGINDVVKVGTAYAANLPANFIIYSSTALRASQTAQYFAGAIGLPVDKIYFSDALYTFNDQELENVIRNFDDRFETAFAFGHNEAITDFVNKFGNIFIDNVPTSGLVTITFEANEWKNIAQGRTGQVIFPRNL